MEAPTASAFNAYKSGLTVLNDVVVGSGQLSDSQLATQYAEKVADLSTEIGSKLWLEIRMSNATDDLNGTLNAIRKVLRRVLRYHDRGFALAKE